MCRTRVELVIWLVMTGLVGGGPVLAQSTAASKSTERCQKAVQKETAKYGAALQKAMATCLQKIAAKVVEDNQVAVDVSGASKSCLAQFYKIGRVDGKSLADRLEAKIAKNCDPSMNPHVADDLLGGVGAGVNQPLLAANLDAYCRHFAPGASTLDGWAECLQGAAECQARQQIAVEFPRALEWFDLLADEFTIAFLVDGDVKAPHALTALTAADGAIDGEIYDDVPGITCGRSRGGLLATGQTTAYLADKNDGLPFFPVFVPDDGTLQLGVAPNYVDNGDGTITDLNTGLMWEKKSDDGGLHDKDDVYSWSQGGDTIWDWLDDVNAEGGTGFAAYNDWRIPNARELDSIINHENVPTVSPVFNDACSGGCTVLTCSCTATAADYWTSTTEASNANLGRTVAFSTGSALAGVKTVTGAIRAVRGNTTAGAAASGPLLATGAAQCDQGAGSLGACPGSPTGQDANVGAGVNFSYTDNGDGTITDDVTQLMWEKLDDNNSDPLHDQDTLFGWYEAFDNKIKVLNGDVSGCAGAGDPATCCSGAGTGTCTTFAGHTDWRLPNVRELQSLSDYGRGDPSIDPAFNNNCSPGCTVTTCNCTASSNYWSSTTLVDIPGYAWFVDFFDGLVVIDSKTSDIRVRAVRGGL